jgi:hypothetical protein
MFCPKCKAEYRTGFIRCSDCDVALVDLLPAEFPREDAPHDIAYTIIRTVQQQLEGDQICSFLQGHGIPARLSGERFRNPYLPVPDALYVLVPDDFADRSADLLEQADRGKLQIDSSDDS